MSGSPAWVRRMAIVRTKAKIPQIVDAWREGSLSLANMCSATQKERSASVNITAFEYYSKLPPELRAMIVEDGKLSIVEMAQALERERGVPIMTTIHMMADLDVR